LVTVKIRVDKRDKHKIRPMPVQVSYGVPIGMLVQPTCFTIVFRLPLFVSLQHIVVALFAVHRTIEQGLVAGVDERRLRFALDRARNPVPRCQCRNFF